MGVIRFSFCAVVCSGLVILAAGGARADLLRDATVVRSQGVRDVERLTDGVVAPQGIAVRNAPAAAFRGAHPYVVFDLGARKTIDAVAIQADNNDVYRVAVSDDGRTFRIVWRVPVVAAFGMQVRAQDGLDASGRYVRLDSVSGDAVRAVTEIWVFSQRPQTFPPQGRVAATLGLERKDLVEERVYAWQVVVGIVALVGLFVLVPRIRRRWYRRGVLAALVLVAAAAWFKFGVLQGDTAVHVWDTYHYFLSSKYFDELGYFELYRCVAKAEREAGNGAQVDRYMIRDLDDNSVHPGNWSATEEGRCRAPFSAGRWSQFARDVAAFRGLFSEELPIWRSFGDHGFNATPVHAAWLHLLTSGIAVSGSALTWLAQIDTVAIALTVALLWWAFGPYVGISSLLVIALGYDWGYRWVGGSLARFVWLAWAAAGMALLKKRRPALGAAALTVSGLLRLFPFVFVGALGLAVVVRAVVRRRIDAVAKRVVAAVAVTAVVGCAFAVSVVGARSFGDFVQVIDVHAHTSLVNHMGLPMLTGAREGDLDRDLSNPGLSDPDQLWKEKVAFNREARKPLWMLGVVAAAAFLVALSLRKFALWQVVACAGPLLFALHNMTSYDYVFVVLMLPLGLHRWRRLVAIVGYTLFTLLVGMYVPDMEKQHIVHSAGFLALMLWMAWDVWRHADATDEPGGDAAAAPKEAASADGVQSAR